MMKIHDEMVLEVEEAPPHCRLRGEALETKVRIAVGITWGDLSLNTSLSQYNRWKIIKVNCFIS